MQILILMWCDVIGRVYRISGQSTTQRRIRYLLRLSDCSDSLSFRVVPKGKRWSTFVEALKQGQFHTIIIMFLISCLSLISTLCKRRFTVYRTTKCSYSFFIVNIIFLLSISLFLSRDFFSEIISLNFETRFHGHNLGIVSIYLYYYYEKCEQKKLIDAKWKWMALIQYSTVCITTQTDESKSLKHELAAINRNVFFFFYICSFRTKAEN